MSTDYKLIILPEAQKDIREIILYIANELKSPQAAINLQEAFQEGIASLAKEPERVKTVDEDPWKDVGIRKLRVKNYYIYFIISDTDHAVKVLAVIYVGRDQKKQMSERGMSKKNI